MNKKYLFITQSDLSMEDSNGRTLIDIFGFVKKENIFSFCTQRNNPYLNAEQTFCIDQSRLFKRKVIHRNVEFSSIKSTTLNNKFKKNPLTCLLRNFAWSLSFCFWKSKLKNWLKIIKPDIIVFNPGDFAFMHKVAYYSAKTTGLKLVIYNTEDYYFKTWNYLHDERGFKSLYPIFRHQLIKAYNKSFSKAKIIMHNTEGLKKEYSNKFNKTKHIVVYHPSYLKVDYNNIHNENFNNEFYYCGSLDKKRDETLFLFSDLLYLSIPDATIVVNGKISDNFRKNLNNHPNIKYDGLIKYEEVAKNLLKRRILLSINSLDEYQIKDKHHAFSTKLADYITSLNIIFHISLPNDEYNVLKSNNLAFISSSSEDIKENLIKLTQCIKNNQNPFENNMINFYEKYLNPYVVQKYVQKEVEKNGEN